MDQPPPAHHHMERPAIHREAPHLTNVHAHELLKDFHKIVGSKKEGVGGNAGSQEKPGQKQTPGSDSGEEHKKGKLPHQLVMTDPYAGMQGAQKSPETRGLKAKSPEDAKHLHDGKHTDVKPTKDGTAKKDASKEVKDPEKDAKETQKRIADTTTIVGKPKNFDSKKPTIAVVDDFKGDQAHAFTGGRLPDTTDFNGKPKAGDLKETPVISHGELSARAAEQNGFNVYRVQYNAGSDNSGEALQSVDQKIKSGELPLRKGDAVTMSIGAHERPLRTDTARYGVPSTSENLAQNKDKLLAAIKSKSEDPNAPAWQRSDAKDITQANEAIKDIQSQGIKVVTAAGNAGADSYTPQDLSSTELSSSKPNGSLDAWSSDHSGTVKGDGVLPVTTQPQSPFSPTPIANDRGNYRITFGSGNSMDVPIAQNGQGYMGGDKLPFDRNSYDPYTFNPKPTPNEAPTAALGGQRMGGDGKLVPPGQALNPDFNQGQLRSNSTDGANPKITTSKTNIDNNVVFSDQPNPNDSHNVTGVIAGTSYVNADYLASQKKSMELELQQGQR